MKVIKNLPSIIGLVVIVLVLVLVLNLFGVFDSIFNTERRDQARTTGVAEVRVRPLDLSCKARIDAVVPLKGEAKSTAHAPLIDVNLTYNTDTITMTAIGDVDTCFPATGATVKHTDTSWLVKIDASQTVLNRPRVKPAATAQSVSYHPGAGRKLVKLLPIVNFFLVNENGSRLTLEAEAFAQSIIGGSSCMKAAWPATKRAIVQTYQDDAKRKGIPASHVHVSFTGQPAFQQNDMRHVPKAFQATKFTVDNRHTVCRLVP